MSLFSYYLNFFHLTFFLCNNCFSCVIYFSYYLDYSMNNLTLSFYDYSIITRFFLYYSNFNLDLLRHLDRTVSLIILQLHPDIVMITLSFYFDFILIINSPPPSLSLMLPARLFLCPCLFVARLDEAMPFLQPPAGSSECFCFLAERYVSLALRISLVRFGLHPETRTKLLVVVQMSQVLEVVCFIFWIQT